MATTERPKVRASKRQTRRRRRERFALIAAKAAREELVNGSRPTLAQSPDYHMAKACGFDATSRDMRRREPPTRSGRRPNAWYQEGDAKVLVKPTESAVFGWWLTLGDDAQDEVYELSRKCSNQGDGISHDEVDPMELLKDMAKVGEDSAVKQSRHVVIAGEDPRSWGRR